MIPQQHGLKPAGMTWRQRADLMRQIAEEHPALILMDSGKPDSLFNMTGGHPAFKPSAAPMAFLTHEDYDLIWRLLSPAL